MGVVAQGCADDRVAGLIASKQHQVIGSKNNRFRALQWHGDSVVLLHRVVPESRSLSRVEAEAYQLVLKTGCVLSKQGL